jgi:hypothetical protein
MRSVGFVLHVLSFFLRIEENLNYVDTSQYGNRCHLRNMSYAGRRLPVQEPHHGSWYVTATGRNTVNFWQNEVPIDPLN